MRPGLPGVSDTVRVVSIIGRFLEHSRIYYFANGGNSRMYLGSADLMRRNLDRRIEILFPLENAALKRKVREEILEIYLKDTSHAHRLLPDGTYERIRPAPGEAPFSSQDWFLAQRDHIAKSAKKE
jgi:polyphosphate kinase